MTAPVYTIRLEAKHVVVGTTRTPLNGGNIRYGRMFLRVQNEGRHPVDVLVFTSKDGERYQPWWGPTAALHDVRPDEERETDIGQHRPYHVKVAAVARGGSSLVSFDVYQIPPEAP